MLQRCYTGATRCYNADEGLRIKDEEAGLGKSGKREIGKAETNRMTRFKNRKIVQFDCAIFVFGGITNMNEDGNG